jgi:histidinol dehydrogenase
MIEIIRSHDRKALSRLLEARKTRLREADMVARRILRDVQRSGDAALARLTRQFDRVDLRRVGLVVSRQEIVRAYRKVPRAVVQALRTAARNIRAVARRQLPKPWRLTNGRGVALGQIVRPLDRVVCYVPGGRFPLPSTLLMAAIPAQVAGVREVLVTSPRPAPEVLVAADILGIEKIFRLGGAQAIAAFAFGTESVPRVAKIVGPGNRYVAAAKKLVAGECGIDFVAGPTELVTVGARGRPEWIAADLVAQAEHDPDAVAIFITPSRRLALKVHAAIDKILRQLRLPVAEQALERQGAIILTRDLNEAVNLVNRLAPEHLMLLDGATGLLDRIESAGSIFLGNSSAVAAGDYASGTNHILPTGGRARLRAGLSTADFVKTIAVQRVTPRGLLRLKPAIVALAHAEGLRAHAYSVETRFSSDGQTA